MNTLKKNDGEQTYTDIYIYIYKDRDKERKKLHTFKKEEEPGFYYPVTTIMQMCSSIVVFMPPMICHATQLLEQIGSFKLLI